MHFKVKMCCGKCEDTVKEEVVDVHGEGDPQPRPALHIKPYSVASAH